MMAAADETALSDRQGITLVTEMSQQSIKKTPIGRNKCNEGGADAGEDPTSQASLIPRLSQEVCSDILFLEAVIGNLQQYEEHNQHAEAVIAQLKELIRKKLRSLNNAGTCVEDTVDILEDRVNAFRRTIMDKYWDEFQTLRQKQFRHTSDQQPKNLRQRRAQRYNEPTDGIDTPRDPRRHSSESDELNSVIDRFDRFISHKYKDELREVRRTSMPRLHQRRSGAPISPEQSLADQILRSRRTNHPDFNTPRSISQIRHSESPESVYSRGLPILTPRDQSYYRSERIGGYGQSPSDSVSYHDEIMDIVAAVNNSKITDADDRKGTQRKQSDRDMKQNGHTRMREQRVKRSEVPFPHKDGGSFRHREQHVKRSEEPLHASQTTSPMRRSEEPVNGEQGNSPRRRSEEPSIARENGLRQKEALRRRSEERMNGRERRGSSPYNGYMNDKSQGWQYHTGNTKREIPRQTEEDENHTRSVATQSDIGTHRASIKGKKKKERPPSPRTNRTSWMRTSTHQHASQTHVCPNCDKQKKKEERQSKRKVDGAKKKDIKPRQKVRANDHRVTNVSSGDIPRPRVYGIATRQEREPEKPKRERQRIDPHFQRQDTPPPEHDKHRYDEDRQQQSRPPTEPSEHNGEKIFEYAIVKDYGRLSDYNNDYFGQFRH